MKKEKQEFQTGTESLGLPGVQSPDFRVEQTLITPHYRTSAAHQPETGLEEINRNFLEADFRFEDVLFY